MDREYIIAGFRIRLEQADRLFVRPGSHMARAFEPFAAEADPAAPLTMRLIPDCTINKKLTGGEPNRELDVFPFDDAEADCHFERTPRGYLFRMVPRNGDRPTLFFKAFDSPDVQSDLLADGREPHQSLMRFGLWIMFGIAISPEAIAIHSSTIECEGRAVLFLGESGTGKSTHTRLWQEHIPGARLLNDDSPIIRMYQGQATAFGSPWSGKTPCYRNISRPIAGIVRLSQAPANEITRLSICGPSDRCSRPAPRHSPTTAICRIESAVRCRTFSPKPLCGTWPACRTRQRPNSPTPRSSKENREPENN